MPSHTFLFLALVVCAGLYEGTPLNEADNDLPTLEEYTALVADLSIPDVMNEIIALLTRSEGCWPADSFEGSTIGQSYGGAYLH